MRDRIEEFLLGTTVFSFMIVALLAALLVMVIAVQGLTIILGGGS